MALARATEHAEAVPRALPLRVRPVFVGLVCLLAQSGCITDLDGIESSVCGGNEPPIPACADNGGCAGGEKGRMEGMVAAHNGVRAAQRSPMPDPPLPPLEWSDDLAAVAAAWAERLVAQGCDLVHSQNCRYGENLAWYAGIEPTAAEVVEQGWASEESCYEFGRFLTTDGCTSACDRSGGCGHFTQIIWRDTRRVGCAVASCGSSRAGEVWVCNYGPAGNIVDRSPY